MDALTAAPGERHFPVARCAPCGRDVLTHVVLDAAGREDRCCVHCDATLDPAELRWVGVPALNDLGYAMEGESEGGCGREGCGQGRCGNK
jgi:hypothetical protein